MSVSVWSFLTEAGVAAGQISTSDLFFPATTPMPTRAEILAQIPVLDMLALLFFLCGWLGYVYVADMTRKRKRNLIGTIDRYRHAWMRQMLKRDNRMVDASMMGNLMRSIAFFCNTSILILFGLITMFGYREKMQSMLESVPYAVSSSALLWEVKILLLVMIFIYAFFMLTWSLRLYNYASIFVGAAPMPYEAQHLHREIAKRGGRLMANAAKHFNSGLRAYYFGLATLAWFIHPLMMMIATVWVVWISYRREFLSHTLRYLAHNDFIESLAAGLDAPKPHAEPTVAAPASPVIPYTPPKG
jgi:uncharacterized membrane protein